MTDETAPEKTDVVTAPDVAPASDATSPGDGGTVPEVASPELVVPDVDHDGLLDWVDAGSRERAEAILAAQELLSPEKRDARLVVDLTSWLEGVPLDAEVVSAAPVEKLESTSIREQEMYEAEATRWQAENPGESLLAVEPGVQPDDQGVGA